MDIEVLVYALVLDRFVDVAFGPSSLKFRQGFLGAMSIGYLILKGLYYV